jgi:hypothetical protein
MAAVAQSFTVAHLKPKFGVRLIRLDMVRVHFNATNPAPLAGCFISTDDCIHPLVMRPATIAASGVGPIIRVLLA